MEQDDKKPDFEQSIQNANQKARQKDIEREEKEEAEARKRAQRNDNFYMLFKDGGSQQVRELIKINPPAAQIFMFLAEQADRTNAVVASGKALAKYLNLSEATVSRALKILTKKEENKEPYLEILKSGGTNVFVLNPEIVWSAWKTGKDYCLFGNAKILITTDEQDISMKKRLNFLLEKKLELPNEKQEAE